MTQEGETMQQDNAKQSAPEADAPPVAPEIDPATAMRALGLTPEMMAALRMLATVGANPADVARKAAKDARREALHAADVAMRNADHVATTLDAILEIVERDCGPEIANRVTMADVARAVRTGATLRKKGAQSK